MENAIEQNGVVIARTPRGIAVGATRCDFGGPLRVEVERTQTDGKFVKSYLLDSLKDLPWRDYYGEKVDHLQLTVRVSQGENVLAELKSSSGDILPFMVLQGEQRHITENYVSVPPALTITDEVGAVWTLGFKTAPKEQSPQGEFAFNVLRDGIETGEIASRIERRSGKVRIFTRHGWKRWTGTTFF